MPHRVTAVAPIAVLGAENKKLESTISCESILFQNKN